MHNTTTQIKFTVNSDVASAFKTRCASQGISMASVISQFMEISKPVKSIKIKTDTRQHRKKAVQEIIGLLENVMYFEEKYRDLIPEKFESRYETADQTCEQLAQALSSLEDAY